jgi:hypothetical protein
VRDAAVAGGQPLAGRHLVVGGRAAARSDVGGGGGGATHGQSESSGRLVAELVFYLFMLHRPCVGKAPPERALNSALVVVKKNLLALRRLSEPCVNSRQGSVGRLLCQRLGFRSIRLERFMTSTICIHGKGDLGYDMAKVVSMLIGLNACKK